MASLTFTSTPSSSRSLRVPLLPFQAAFINSATRADLLGLTSLSGAERGCGLKTGRGGSLFIVVSLTDPDGDTLLVAGRRGGSLLSFSFLIWAALESSYALKLGGLGIFTIGP